MYFELRSADLDNIVDRTSQILDELRDSRILVTGATGFFGRWILASLLWANETLGTRINIVAISRDPKRFLETFPEANNPHLEFFQGDIRESKLPDGEFQTIIHMATDSKFSDNKEHLQLLDSILFGTRRLLDYAVNRAKSNRFLYVSSGAVYGGGIDNSPYILEDNQSAPSPSHPHSLIGNSKRAAEQMCALYHQQYHLETKIARCFSFVGHHLPMNSYFAIGNFIHDALFSDSIRVIGDGSPIRSYLYAADLSVWLLTILCRGRSNYPYNVGSDEPITVKELAELVSQEIAPMKKVRFMDEQSTKSHFSRYVPSIQRARQELALDIWTPLPDAITRTSSCYSKVFPSNLR